MITKFSMVMLGLAFLMRPAWAQDVYHNDFESGIAGFSKGEKSTTPGSQAKTPTGYLGNTTDTLTEFARSIGTYSPEDHFRSVYSWQLGWRRWWLMGTGCLESERRRAFRYADYVFQWERDAILRFASPGI